MTLRVTVFYANQPVVPIAVSSGLVLFCNSNAKYCEDFNILGQAQLYRNGSASLRLVLPIGVHHIRAVFQGTYPAARSASDAETVTVIGQYPTSTALSDVPYYQKKYNLIAKVSSYGNSPTGPVSFVDATNQSAVIASAAPTPGLVFSDIPSPQSNSVLAAVGDFNGDGNLDEIAFDSSNDDLIVLFGRGDGTFTAGPTTPVEQPAVLLKPVVVVADFNADDRADLAVLNQVDGVLRVFLGKGDGTFSLVTSTSIPDSPIFLAVGDFNIDGYPDLVVSNSKGALTLLGDGHGNFNPVPSGINAPAISPMVVADLNGDGIPDLVFCAPDTVPGLSGVLMYVGLGNGFFLPGGLPATKYLGSPTWVAVADFNGDGKADLAVADYASFDGASEPGQILIFLKGENGNFNQAVAYPGGDPAYVSIGDFNGDGQADLIVGNALYCPEFGVCNNGLFTSLYQGNGDGTFTFLRNLNYTTAQSIPADFNADGRTDLALYSPLTVDLAEGQVTAEATGISVAGAPGLHEVFAQYPGDAGHLASISRATTLQGPQANTVTSLNVAPLPAFPGEPLELTAAISSLSAGSDAITGTVTFSNGPSVVGTAPVTGGKAVFSNKTLPISMSSLSLTAFYSGDAKFTPSVSPAVHVTKAGNVFPPTATVLTVSPSSPVAQGTVISLSAAVSYDATPLIRGLVLFYDSASGQRGNVLLGRAQLTLGGAATLKLRLGIGSHALRAVFQGINGRAGSASAAQTLSVTGMYKTSTAITAQPPTYAASVITFGPLPATGRASFVDASNEDYNFATATLGPAKTQVALKQTSSLQVNAPQLATAAGDFNGDGLLDIAVFTPTNSLLILLGNADGTFTAISSTAFPPGSNTYAAIAVADFNCDGKPDLALLQSNWSGSNGSVAILLGRSDGTFRSVSTRTVAPFSSSLVAGDFNNDGVPDLIASGVSGTTTLLGYGDGFFVSGAVANLAANGALLVGDFNGDGILDLAGAIPNGLALGNGDLTFATSSVPVGCPPLVEADFNRDGMVDLACLNGSGDVTILLGNGNGTFVTSWTETAYPGVVAMSAGDFNGDGIPDLVVAEAVNGSNLLRMDILLGSGDGTLFGGPAGPVVSVPPSLIAGDFNGDGLSDVLAAFFSENALSVQLAAVTNTSEATATNATVPGGGMHQVFASVAGDATHKGSQSSIVAVSGTKIQTSTELTVSSTGTRLTLTAVISPAEFANYTADGTVTFYSAGVVIGTGVVTKGSASFSASTTGGGSYTAIYQGDANFAGSPSGTAH